MMFCQFDICDEATVDGAKFCPLHERMLAELGPINADAYPYDDDESST